MKAIALAAVLVAASAQAQVVSSGPSFSFMELRPGYAHPVTVAAGAGYQLSLGFFQADVWGEMADLLDVGGTVYGTAISTPAGATAGSLSMALFVGSFNELFALGIGEDIIGAGGGVFNLPPYAVFMFNPLKLSFGAPPTVSGAPGVMAARRWTTTYLGQ
jgi:hypothetical protein